ncbi:MAG: diaminopimelate epimerase [Nitrospirae bacterium]|nr:diaminopimelate epimerase [Nitrospirota bacterium]
MNLDFTKMHGTGNDFILIDCRPDETAALFNHPADAERIARTLCERRFGVGADQMLLLYDSPRADFRMVILNADGSEVEMCGNGIRCFAKYLWERGMSSKETLDIETGAGIIRPRMDGDLVRVDMGEPILDGPRIPVNIEGHVTDHPIESVDKKFNMTCVSMGNPHAVIFVDDVDNFPVEKYGPPIENSPLFPRRTNVEFVQVLSGREIKMRVWERGSGETLACGTGACAAAVASHINKFTGRDVKVRLRGGELHIRWDGNNRVFMSGPAVEVFQGVVTV